MPKKRKTKSIKNRIGNDGFENLLTGLGTSKDPNSFINFKRGKSKTLDFEFTSSLYSQNWLGSAVVDVPANDMTRNWIKILDQEAEVESAIEKELQ